MKERFLLHTCCAPCGIAVIDELRKSYDLSVLFYNPNIHPKEEYLKRKAEAVRICGEWDIPMIDADYDPESWDAAVRGLEDEAEGGRRCPVCFGHRLSYAAAVAARDGFDLFGSTLTTGRNKRADIIDPIGEAAGRKYAVRFYPQDWKKGGRQEKSGAMVAERCIYRQDYCGCRYSLAERGARRGVEPE